MGIYEALIFALKLWCSRHESQKLFKNITHVIKLRPASSRGLQSHSKTRVPGSHKPVDA